MLRSRAWIGLAALVLAAALWPGEASSDPARDRIDAALSAAAAYLVERQEEDGAWRSGVHGSFRDGPSLTSHVLKTLFHLGWTDPETRAAFERGVGYLMSMTDGQGTIRPEFEALHFPVYTSAAIAWVVVLDDRSPERLAAQEAWVTYLRQRQLNARLGWERGDAAFGGWGYAPTIPRKPRPGEMGHPLAASNLSATVYAAGALRAAGAKPDDPVWEEILIFVDRCQNYPDDPAGADDRFDDGGFFFMPEDAANNKAGVAGIDVAGRERFHSYGSMTADGLRAMLACGRPADHPRVTAARRWLMDHFSATENPGAFEPDREVLRDGTYYYYCWSVAHALARLDVRIVETPRGEVDWAAALAEALLARQRADGSWASEVSSGREDDPIVATSFAAAALAICRERLLD